MNFNYLRHGYHGTNSRDNLFYIETGEIIYHIAAVGIIYDAKAHKQRFFIGHTDDIVRLRDLTYSAPIYVDMEYTRGVPSFSIFNN